MSEILPTITIEIGEADNNAYPLRLLDQDETELAKESIDKAAFDRSKWDLDPIATMLNTSQSPLFAEIGTKLYSLLHQGDVAEKWDTFTKNNISSCRVQLRIKPDELSRFPWELICINKLRRPATNSKQTFLRTYEHTKPDLLRESSLLPLRILIVVGASENDNNVLPEAEISEIETQIRNNNLDDNSNKLAYRLIDIEKLLNPTIPELLETYKEFKPHIFHFIGHGGIDNNNNANLIIQHPNGVNAENKTIYQKVNWQYDSIYTSFNNAGWLPRLVLINSCRTDTKGENPNEELQQHIWSIGDVFRELGVPAVIAMQADISGEGAGIFSGALYKYLAEFNTLDQAVAQARNTLQEHLGGFDVREWAIPILSVSMAPEKILPFNLEIDDEKLVALKSCPDLKSVRLFSSRVKQRRKLLGKIYPSTNRQLKDLIIVRGKKDAGKSWLTIFCLEALALLNLDVRYVPVSGDETLDWLDFLLQIRDGDKSSPGSAIRTPLNEEAFYQFNWELIHRTNLSEPPEWDKKPIKANIDDLGEKSDWTQDFIDKTFTSFRRSLLQSAENDKPLVIVFDDFPQNAKKKEFFKDKLIKYIIPNLIVPISNNNLREKNTNGERVVKFIFILQDERDKNDPDNLNQRYSELEYFNLDTLKGKFTDFWLNQVSFDELISCLSEYSRYDDPEEYEENIALQLKIAEKKYLNENEIPLTKVKEIVDFLKN